MKRAGPVVIALAVALVMALALWLVAVLFPWLWLHYELPSLVGNGPEDLTSLLIVTVVTALVYPPVRAWIRRELDHLHAKADHTADVLHHLVKSLPDDLVSNEINGVHIDDLRPQRGRPSKGSTPT